MLNIVVEGCCHGELPKIYDSVLRMEQVLSVMYCDFFFLYFTRVYRGQDGRACPLLFERVSTVAYSTGSKTQFSDEAHTRIPCAGMFISIF